MRNSNYNGIKIIYFILIAIIVILVIWLIGRGMNNSNNNSITTSTKITSDGLALLDGYTGKYDDYGVNYIIQGTVKNTTSTDYSDVQITFNLYNKDKTIIGIALAKISSFKANTEWHFEANGYTSLSNKVVSYEFNEISKK